MMERTENEFLIQCLVCQENENFLSIQLLLYPFILLFNLLENGQKSNYTLHYSGKKFTFTFLSKVGRIKLWVLLVFYHSFFFSFPPYQTTKINIFHSKIHSKFLFLSLFSSTKRSLIVHAKNIQFLLRNLNQFLFLNNSKPFK